MKEDMKYIYFETYGVVNADNPRDIRTHVIQNVNVLKYKPVTNSNGFWGYRNVSSYEKRRVVVDQTWIDLEKYDMTDEKSYLRDRVEEALAIIEKYESL